MRKEKGEMQRIVIATHHAPSLRGTTQPGKDHHRQGVTYVNDILGNKEIDGLWESGKNWWVFGHTHFSINKKMDNINVYSNQRGGASQEHKEEEERQLGGDPNHHHWNRQGCIEV